MSGDKDKVCSRENDVTWQEGRPIWKANFISCTLKSVRASYIADKVCSREWEDQSGKQFSFLIKMYASHIAYCICIRTIKSKSTKECLNFNEKSMDSGKRKWCHLTAGRSIWKAISLSCTSFTILFELPALHIASLYQGNQKQMQSKAKQSKWRPLLNFK